MTTTSPREQALPPIRKQVVVDVPPAVAFALFTDRIGDWWPLAGHSIGGSSSSVGFRDGRLVEQLEDGTTCSWGEVEAWDPPRRLVLRWHPGSDAGLLDTEVEVLFRPDGEGTAVSLVHSGWGTERSEAHGSYGPGWDAVLGAFTAAAA